MISQCTTNDIQTWVAIDIAKDRHFAIVQPGDGPRRKFSVASCREEHDRFVSYLHSCPQPCRIGFEATGNYHRTLAYRLRVEGFEVCLISSVAASRYREAVHNSWDKNDPKDAAILLDMLRRGLTQRYVDPGLDHNHDIQELSKTYANITMARTRLQHSLLTHYIPIYFPEMLDYWRSTRSDWFIEFLLRFPVPASITALSVEEFRSIVWPILSRKHRKAELVRDLYALACHSIAVPMDPNCLSVQTFMLQLRRYRQINVDRKALESNAVALLSKHPDYQRLITVPGIGPICALTILAEGGDLRRFHHHRQFLKYCGLDLAKSQSGASRGHEVLSKRGNSRLRLCLWQAATVAARLPENGFRDKFTRYMRVAPQDRDRKRQALTAVAAKMARVVYSLVKFDRNYSGRYESALPSGSIPLCRAVETI